MSLREAMDLGGKITDMLVWDSPWPSLRSLAPRVGFVGLLVVGLLPVVRYSWDWEWDWAAVRYCYYNLFELVIVSK